LKGIHFQDSTTIKKSRNGGVQSDPGRILPRVNGSMEEENAKVHPNSKKLV